MISRRSVLTSLTVAGLIAGAAPAFGKSKRSNPLQVLDPDNDGTVDLAEAKIIERINGFFGYRAVACLKLTQGPLPNAPLPGPKPPRPLAAAETNALRRSLDGITDPELRAALERWGQAVLGDQPGPAARPLAPRKESR